MGKEEGLVGKGGEVGMRGTVGEVGKVGEVGIRGTVGEVGTVGALLGKKGAVAGRAGV